MAYFVLVAAGLLTVRVSQARDSGPGAKKGKNIFVLEFKRTSDQRRDYSCTEKREKQEQRSSTTFSSRAFRLL